MKLKQKNYLKTRLQKNKDRDWETVMWCPDDYPFEASIGILLGFYDGETDEELPTQYDACNVLVNALVHFPWGQSMLAPLHELLPLQDYIKRQSYIEEQRTKIFC